ncbi:unnamed protein product [Mucor hiemalis]
MNNTIKFYHYLPPSGEFASDEKPGYQPKQDGAAIKSLYHMEGIPDDDSLSEDEDDDHFNTPVAMEEIDLEATPLPNLIWTPTSLLINEKKMEEPSYLVKNQFSKLSHPTCIVKDGTKSLCETFHGLTINESTVYRHITEKLEFTLTRTQARFVNRNSDDTLEQRRQFIEHIDAMNDQTFYKRKCILVDESGFKINMVRPVTWSKKGQPAEVDVEAEGTNLSILGCMSAYGLTAVSQQIPKSSRKKHKTATSIKRGLPHGINSSHFTYIVCRRNRFCVEQAWIEEHVHY